jgi:hypothetical protein
MITARIKENVTIMPDDNINFIIDSHDDINFVIRPDDISKGLRQFYHPLRRCQMSRVVLPPDWMITLMLSPGY